MDQHKLQEEIIGRLQSDIDQLQAALAAVATSHSTENARLTQVNAELNEALAIKDQEVLQVRQHMTEFEDSHKLLVESLQATLSTINEEADAARKSRDEAVKALESLREELEALRHSLPINSKHMSLSQWSAEQQQSQQEEQLKAIRDLEQKLDGQVEEVKGEQQRAGVLEANTKRKSMHLTMLMEHHLQLSNAIAHQTFSPVPNGEDAPTDDDDDTKVSSTESPLPLGKDAETGMVSVRTMLKFLSHLQSRPSTLSHLREGTEATLAGDLDADYESQLRVYLSNMNEPSVMEPWAKEKHLEGEVQQLEERIGLLLENQKNGVATDDALLKQQQILESKEKDLLLKETSLKKKEQSLEEREEELVNEELELQKKMDALPLTPPMSAPITPFGSPGNLDLVPNSMGARFAAEKDDEKKTQQIEMVAQQAKLIKSLEEKIIELEKRGPLPSPLQLIHDESFSSSLPGTPRSSTALSRIGSQTMRSSLLNGAPDTPPPTIALPPIPVSTEGDILSPRSTSPGTDKKPTLPHTVSSESLTNNKAAIEAAVAAAVAKSQEAQKELVAKLEKSESELNKSRTKNKELESELVSTTQAQSSRQGQAAIDEMQKLRQENAELAQVLEEIRKSLDQVQATKTQLETQFQREKGLKDEAIRMQDHLQTQLEMEKQKKKGFLCF